MDPLSEKNFNRGRLHEYLKHYRQRHAHRTFKSFRWALRGLYYTLSTQRNFQIQLVAGMLVTVLMFVYPLDWGERQLLIGAISLVLTCEVFNTALEYLVDLFENKFNRQAMMAKDIAAGAVLVISFNAVIHGMIILGPFVWATLTNLFK